ncbi:hypothetical protein D9757_009144 [Collybiopsis confluens]|uniref:Uncharacterized protein n=1 Tax=Collybiopsis confluens TaxID=2823264 RepID=A0A8H5H7W4_9AGAR|nr:hypothetical protein D9757_009148 [Collybiopsis confluens]KAF5378253.1 hypothetical protein D9757_009144 [Collybiopsis confluens]
MSTSNGRPNLPADTLWFERAILVGDALSEMVYGAVVVVFLRTMYILLRRKRSPEEGAKWPLVTFTLLLFSLGTIFIGMDLHSLQLMFIDHREYPGGPIAYTLSQYGQAITVFPNVCAVAAEWLADGYMLYRCLVIFRLKLYIVALPVLMYLSVIAMGIMQLFQSSRPNANLWTKTTVNFGIPYFAISAALNITITFMINARLLMWRRDLKTLLGTGKRLSIPYMSIASILVESSALYTTYSILFIVPYGLGSHVSNIFLPSLIEVQVLGPLLIILRVATRRAWSSNTMAVTTIQFQQDDLHSTEAMTDSDPEVQFAASQQVQLRNTGKFLSRGEVL